jgi:hypothetical protein
MAKQKTTPRKISVADLKQYSKLLDDARSHESKARDARDAAKQLGTEIIAHVKHIEPRKKRITLGGFNVVIDRERKGIYWKGAYIAAAGQAAAEKLAEAQPLQDKLVVAPIE